MKKVVLILMIFIMAIMVWSIITNAEEPSNVISTITEWSNTLIINAFVNNTQDKMDNYSIEDYKVGNENNRVIRLRTSNFFQTNPSIYCFEPNTQLIGDPNGNSRKKYIGVQVAEGMDVENDELAYIANMEDKIDDKVTGTGIVEINETELELKTNISHFNFNVKQNLIWDYIKKNMDTGDNFVLKLKDLDKDLYKHYDYSTNYYSKIKEYLADEYVKIAKNVFSSLGVTEEGEISREGILYNKIIAFDSAVDIYKETECLQNVIEVTKDFLIEYKDNGNKMEKSECKGYVSDLSYYIDEYKDDVDSYFYNSDVHPLDEVIDKIQFLDWVLEQFRIEIETIEFMRGDYSYSENAKFAELYTEFTNNNFSNVKVTTKENNGNLDIIIEGVYGDFDIEKLVTYHPQRNNSGIKIFLVKEGKKKEYDFSNVINNKISGGVYEDGETLKYHFENKKQSFTISKVDLEDVSEVKIEVYKTKYKARIYPLIPANSNSQKLIYIDAKKDIETRTWTHSFDSTEVSLQKYITGVYVVGETKSEINDRINLYASRELAKNPEPNHSVDINWKDSVKLVNGQYKYKNDNPISINQSNIVEYTITAYNNDENKIARNVKITDEIVNPNKNVKLSIIEEGKELLPENDLFLKGKVEVTTGENSATLTIDVGDLGVREEKTYKVYIQYNSYLEGITTNKAWISSDNGSKLYRTYDEDYIYMSSVSLQKYITKVTSKDGTETTYNNRINRKAIDTTKDPIYKGKDGNIYSEQDFLKSSHAVEINLGDTVEYTITAYNNSVQDEYVVITDTYNSERGKIINIIEDSEIQCHWEEESNGKRILEQIKLPAGKSATFRILIKYDTYYLEEVIENKATITCERNNDVYRTEDSDYVIMLKTTNVSLQKYITAVYEGEIRKEISGRENRYAGTNKELNIENSQYIHEKAYISKRFSAKIDYKMKDSVKIEAGDRVEYTITVYNNSDTPSDFFNIKDIHKGTLVSIIEEEKQLWPKDNESDNDNKTTVIVGDENFEIKNISLDAGFYVSRTFKIVIIYDEYISPEQLIENKAYILSKNNKTTYRTYDADYVEMKKYAVSLQKIIYSVNNKKEGISNFDRWTSWECTDKINKNNEEAYKKYNNPVTLEYGDAITYAIKIKNNGETNVKNIKIKDTLPVDIIRTISFNDGNEISDIKRDIDNNILEFILKEELKPRGEKIVYINTYVKQLNTSVEVYRNHAQITEIYNRNDIVVTDTTLNDNEDADYFQTRDIIISGMVWNDKALNKTQDKYNGLFNDGAESKLSGIKVYLYRQEILDVNGDGKVDSTDKLKLYNYYMSKFKDGNSKSLDLNGDGNNDDEIDKDLADFNGDGVLDTTDYLIYKSAYIDSTNPQIARKIAETTTNENGEYKFETQYINIKGPKKKGTNRWSGKYYSYFVVFEYDGIMYTSTPDGTTCVDINNVEAIQNGNYKINSNAKEGVYTKELALLVTRQELNDKFSTVNNETKVEYITENLSGYIPKSKYIYNENDNKIHSSTNLIDIANVTEEQLKYVNLGLRGRDTFDLSLTSNVENIKVTVNGVSGVYTRNSVSLRNSDINAQDEDMANIKNEKQTTYVLEDKNNNKPQYIRKSDIFNELYLDTRLTIDVTYKITIKNESITQGSATKIVNYYDTKYFKGTENVVYYLDSDNNKNWISNIKDGTSGDNYKSLEITIPEKILNQGDTYDIYVVYKLNNPSETLKVLLGEKPENKVITYNMSEILEYKTVPTIYEDGTNNEATRGLIDKDSAPGSANKEQVRLISTEGNKSSTVNGEPTTVKYYFDKVNLSDLKYEDDTYVAPALYFALPPEEDKDKDEIPDYSRAIVGNVFRDETKTNDVTKIKTGNGKLDEGEAPVYGATVELIEVLETEEKTIGTIRNSTITDENGYFKFVDFLPGNYIIRYHYGDTANTVLLKQNGNVNAYSFNGEDYQATNNSGKPEGMDTNKLSEISNFWYVYNEKDGVSTATDDEARRNKVIENVISEKDDNTNKVMTLLNLAREGTLSLEQLNEMLPEGTLIEQTNMFADTPKMYFTLEKTQLNENGDLVLNIEVGEYKITNMNFGIAEVPVTTIDLQKYVKSFEIIDASRQNVIAKVSKLSENKWKIEGNVTPEGRLHASVEDPKLQGAYLQITYGIKSNIKLEKNYDDTTPLEGNIVIKDLVDIVDNNLVYNPDLENNSHYWEKIEKLNRSSIANISSYDTLVKAKDDLINKLNEGKEITITLEKVLASNSTVEQIINSTVDSYVYRNTVEITAWDTNIRLKDRIRNKDRYIIIPCVQYDTATSEEIVITPPAGDSSIHTVYYILAAISLGIIGVGVFAIKKYALKD